MAASGLRGAVSHRLHPEPTSGDKEVKRYQAVKEPRHVWEQGNGYFRNSRRNTLMMERMEDREGKKGPLCLCLWEDGGGGGVVEIKVSFSEEVASELGS